MLARTFLWFFSTFAATALAAQTASPQTEFAELAAKNGGVITLDAALFDKLTAPNREWSATIQLTAMGANMKCAPCREFDPHYKAVAKSWSKVSPEIRDQHFFATLDFAVAMEVFKRLGLQTAPVLHTYPPIRGPRRTATSKTDVQVYDFHSHGFEAEPLAEQLSRTTPIPIPYRPPPNYGAMASFAISALGLAVVARFFLPIFTSRWTWALLVIGGSILFTTGFMFVRIRGSNFVGYNRKGHPEWMSGGYQNQYGMEVPVLGAVYFTAAFSYTALIFLVPRITSPSKQRLAAYIWSGLLVVLLSVLLSFFRTKNTMYPFRLLF